MSDFLERTVRKSVSLSEFAIFLSYSYVDWELKVEGMSYSVYVDRK